MTISSDQQRTSSDQHERDPVSPPWAGPLSSLAKRFALVALFAAAVALGFVYQDRLLAAVRRLSPAPDAGRPVLYWTSPMDPDFRSDKPGKDSMGMDLVPVYRGQPAPQQPTVIDPVVTENEYATVPVEKGPLVRTIQTVGAIEYAEPLIGDVTLKFDAWLEKLYVDHEGQPVRRGEPLFELYSPDLVATQQEFLSSLQAWQQARQSNNPSVLDGAQQNYSAARQRLQFWDVSDPQIDELARTGKVRKSLVFYSPFDGVVVQKRAFEGKFVPAGQLLYRVADLSKVWVHVFAYQNQLHCVYEGQGATLRLANLPGRTFHGKVVYVYPYLDPTNRAVKVRLEFANPDLVLKPGMYADIRLEPHRMGTGIKIPEDAILQTGQRSLVYVARPGNKFEAQDVTTGMELDGGMVTILDGLRQGQQIVAAPRFLLDSESSLRAANRRFEPATPGTGQVPAAPMSGMAPMPGMNMPGAKHEGRGQSMPGMEHSPATEHQQPATAAEQEPPMPGMKGSHP